MHQSCKEKKRKRKEQVTDWESVKEKEANRIFNLVRSSSPVCPHFWNIYSINVFIKAGHLEGRHFAAFSQPSNQSHLMKRWAAGSLICLRCFSAVWPLGGSTGPVSRMFYQIVQSLVGFVRYYSEKNILVIKKKLKKCLQEKTQQTGSSALMCHLFVPPSTQGEDGFPGFKGDMGIKGDRVWVCENKIK